MRLVRVFCVGCGLSASAAFGAGAPLLLDWGEVQTTGIVQQAHVRALQATSRATHAQRASVRGTVPWLVQFRGVIQEEWKTALIDSGAKLKGYIPENAFLIEATPQQIVSIAALPDVVWVGEYASAYKRSKRVRLWLATGKPDTKEYNVLLFNPEDLDVIGQEISSLPGATITHHAVLSDRGLIRVRLNPAGVEAVTAWSEVEWVESYVPPRLYNDIAVRTNKMNVTNVWSALGLTGAGQIIAVCDTGLDSGNASTLHRDFTNRLVWAQALGRTTNWSDPDSHGTHVAGSVLGSGISSTGRFKGVAYEASLVFQSVLDSGGGLGGLPADLNNLLRAAFTNGARIHSDSWGAAVAGAYNTDARNLDMFVWSNKTMLVLVAAGNEGVDANANGVIDLDSMSAPGTAKNCLTVGAAENFRTTGGYNAYTWGTAWPTDYPTDPIKTDKLSSPDTPQGLAAFSSRGPCDDGRIKPDLVAPGTDIISTRSKASTDTGWGTVSGNTNYIYMGGTSMATPLTAGAAGLARQWLITSRGITNPSAAILKALLISGARDMAPGQYGTGATQEIPATRPNNMQGYGHVNLYYTLAPPTNQFLSLFDTNSLSTGQTNIFLFPVYSISTTRYVLTMTYSDYFAASGSGKKLVNDLDLTVQKPSGGFIFANGRVNEDATNNTEMVEFAPDEVGTYTVRVVGRTVPMGGSQAYALVARGPLNTPAPPVFASLGAQTAITAVATSFVVSAIGNPGPTLSLQSTTASAGYDFIPATGVLTYTPPFADAGARSFTFLANNSEGIATQVVNVTVNPGPPPAPSALWASGTNETSITAEWMTSDGATGYLFDAHTSPSFVAMIPGTDGIETFSSIGSSSSSYLTRLWTNQGVVWTAFKARTDYTIVGQAIGLQNAADAYIMSGLIPGGIDELSIVHRRNTGSSTTFDLFINTTKVVSAVTLTTSITTTKVTGINISGPFTIMVSNSGGNVARFDELMWTNPPVVGGNFVPGFSNRSVAATSVSVTGLTAASTYFLRARAVNAIGSSAYSPTTEAITLSEEVITTPAVSLGLSRLVADESGPAVQLPVVLSHAAHASVQLRFIGTAQHGVDFTCSTTVVFSAAGSTTNLIAINIVDDQFAEGPESTRVVVLPIAGVTNGGLMEAALVIRDNDAFSVVTANLTSGTNQQYETEGARILEALNPDIVLMQEFRLTNGTTYRTWVDEYFGTSFYYHVESTSGDGGNPLPNGVISRWPILAAGEWSDNANIGNRDFAWARIDLPGARDLHAVSVHFKAESVPGDADIRESQARLLTNYITQAGIPAYDYLVIGGDLNLQTRTEAALTVLTARVVSDTFKPTDQVGDPDTNAGRSRPYDLVLPSSNLNARHRSFNLFGYTFPSGMVFDTRIIWTNGLPPPAQTNDSAVTNMQHMAVVKVFEFEPDVSVDPPSSFTAVALGQSAIRLTYTANSAGDDVVIVWNHDGNFSVPGGTPPAPGGSFAGGTVLYAGAVSPQDHTGLSICSTYYYKCWSYWATNYSSVGLTASTATETLPAPASIWVQETNGTLLVAAWSAVAGADSYRLDVSTSDAFSGDDPGGSPYVVNFESGTKASYADGDVTLNGLSWNLNQALIGGDANDRFNGLRSARVRSNDTSGAAGLLTMNASTNMGLSSITFVYAKYGSDANTAGRVDISTNSGATWISAGTFDVTSTTLTPFNVTNLNIVGNVRIRIVKTSGTTTRYNIDDIALFPFGSSGTFVPGYQDREISGTTAVVTGLIEGATYYFRVRAVAGPCWGDYTAVVAVTTKVSQIIDFPAIATQTLTNTLTLAATASSGLPVVFSLISGSAVLTNVNAMTFTQVGLVRVAAMQPGNDQFIAASSVTNTFEVIAFIDTNTNNIPDEWELENFGSLTHLTETSDADGDGMFDWQEYIAGTDPNDAAKLLRIDFKEQSPDGTSLVIQWSSESNRWYQLGRKTNLVEAYHYITSGLPAAPPFNIYTDSPPIEGPWYYRVNVRMNQD